MNMLDVEMDRLYRGAAAGETRCIGLPFRRQPDDGEAGHWERLCAVANAVQGELGLPAPAVSVSGDGGFGLWLSLAQPVAAAQAREFRDLLCAAYCPGAAGAADAPPALPPQLNQASGKWAAFIHPGMGASFAGDEGLEMPPPEAGQVALLEGLESATPAQFAHALARLRPQGRAAEGLLLRDATLEDIVKHLHSKNIEPTFRFLK
jgi:hypothetical protein